MLISLIGNMVSGMVICTVTARWPNLPKGNLFKGPFHIPRMMIRSYMLCQELL